MAAILFVVVTLLNFAAVVGSSTFTKTQLGKISREYSWLGSLKASTKLVLILQLI